MPEIVPAQEIKAGVDSKETLSLRKRAGVPEVDPEQLPSSVATKMLACIGKRKKKMADVADLYKKIAKPSELQEKTLCSSICFSDSLRLIPGLGHLTSEDACQSQGDCSDTGDPGREAFPLTHHWRCRRLS